MSLSLLIVLAMGFIWCMVIGTPSVGQFLLGSAMGALYVLTTRAGRGYALPLARLPRLLWYLSIYLFVLVPYDIVRSNVDLARRLLRRDPDVRSGIVRLHLGEMQPATSALIAHAITVGPGQLVIDYSPDGQTIYIHLIDVADIERKHVAFWRVYNTVLRRIFG